MWTPDPSTIITAEQKAASDNADFIEVLRGSINRHIDAEAKSRGYDDTYSMSSYVSSSNKAWKEEATAFILWRDAVWASAYTIFDKLLNGKIKKKDVKDIIGMLPKPNYPS